MHRPGALHPGPPVHGQVPPRPDAGTSTVTAAGSLARWQRRPFKFAFPVGPGLGEPESETNMTWRVTRRTRHASDAAESRPGPGGSFSAVRPFFLSRNLCGSLERAPAGRFLSKSDSEAGPGSWPLRPSCGQQTGAARRRQREPKGRLRRNLAEGERRTTVRLVLSAAPNQVATEGAAPTVLRCGLRHAAHSDGTARTDASRAERPVEAPEATLVALVPCTATPARSRRPISGASGRRTTGRSVGLRRHASEMPEGWQGGLELCRPELAARRRHAPRSRRPSAHVLRPLGAEGAGAGVPQPVRAAAATARAVSLGALRSNSPT